MSRWVNLLALLPNTILTILVISIAFLRFYDQTDFTLLGYLAHPRIWSNRLTVAALLVAMVNLGVEWNRRNRETDRLAQAEAQRIAEEQRRIAEEQRRIIEEQRRIAEAERTARRARIEAERDLALLNFLVDPSPHNREVLMQVIALLAQYRESL
ncbi:hypothetical protein [Thermosynechococcus sp. FA-CM-4201]